MGKLDNISINNKESELLVKNPTAPFTEEQVECFNDMQKRLGLYTCMGNNSTCERGEDNDYGLLKAEKHHLICPCGRYRQRRI